MTICIFHALVSTALAKKSVLTGNPYLGITEHKTENGVYAVIVNYSDKPQSVGLKVRDGFEISEIYYGSTDTMEPYDAAVTISRADAADTIPYYIPNKYPPA